MQPYWFIDARERTARRRCVAMRGKTIVSPILGSGAAWPTTAGLPRPRVACRWRAHRRVLGAALFSALSTARPVDVAAGEVPLTSGYTWGQIRYPSALQPEERRNPIIEGAVRQSLNWPSLTSGVYLSSFGEFRFKHDKERLDFNNELLFAIGTELVFLPDDVVELAVGVRHEWDHRYVSDRTPSGFVGFLNWGLWWRKPLPGDTGAEPFPLAYVARSWGEIRYPSSQEIDESDNAIFEGSLQGGIDWLRVTSTVVLNSFAEIEVKADTQRFDFNNEVQPGVGLKLQWTPFERLAIELGGEFAWEYRFVSGRQETGAVAFLNWYASW